MNVFPRKFRNILFGILAISYSTMSQSLLLFSSHAPPHMIEPTENGIDIDIVTQVLKQMNYQVNLQFSPLKRGMVQVANKKADVFIPTFLQPDNNKIFISDTYIDYRPMIFSLKSKALNINNLDDLAGKSIISFQGAKGYFGKKYQDAVNNAMYVELHDMSKFPKMLLHGRYDVVVLDYYIFYYFLKAYQKSIDKNTPSKERLSSLIAQHDIIPPAKAHAGFNDRQLRDKFNQSLKQFINSPEYQAIINQYIGDIH